MNPVKSKDIVSFKQGPRHWLCQTAGAAALSGGSVVHVVTSVGVFSK
jgi:hypothetical protein